MLTNADHKELTAFRRALHRRPEISGDEKQTANTIRVALEDLCATQIVTGLGGHGVAGVFDSGCEGPTVLFRAELDALPIHEISQAEWRSEYDGKGHLCGHDGHMTMLLALGRLVARTPIKTGRLILMFQPAEEDGSGARAVVADPRFAALKPDWAFAIHNEPGRPFGYVSTRPGLMNCASLGLKITLTGKTAHAADPETGTSPVHALPALIPQLQALGAGGALTDDFRLVTICHVQAGAPTFGIAPGHMEVFATLRSAADAPLGEMTQQAKSIADTLAQQQGLVATFEICDHFAASINNAEATQIAQKAMTALSIEHGNDGLPMRASEDFGVFGWDAKACMLCLGPGIDYPALHNPDYDFPDDLIPIGARLFDRIARDILG